MDRLTRSIPTDVAAATLPAARRSSRLLRVAAHAVLMLGLVACGSDSGPDQEDDDPTPPPPDQSTLVPSGTPGFIEARTSQIVTNGGAPSWVFDDFTFSTAGTIRTVRWQGIYCVQQPNAPAPTPTASSFTVTFYEDVSGRPNTATPLQASTYTVAQAGQVFDKTVGGLFCGTAANTTWPFYNYAVTLSTPFSAAAGTKYWISVQATTPSYDVYFGWRDGTANNNLSLQLFDGVYTTFNVDRAYALEP
jgi:hypothetical protein